MNKNDYFSIIFMMFVTSTLLLGIFYHQYYNIKGKYEFYLDNPSYKVLSNTNNITLREFYKNDEFCSVHDFMNEKDYFIGNIKVFGILSLISFLILIIAFRERISFNFFKEEVQAIRNEVIK